VGSNKAGADTQAHQEQCTASKRSNQDSKGQRIQVQLLPFSQLELLVTGNKCPLLVAISHQNPATQVMALLRSNRAWDKLRMAWAI
jgi:hypothetical protein